MEMTMRRYFLAVLLLAAFGPETARAQETDVRIRAVFVRPDLDTRPIPQLRLRVLRGDGSVAAEPTTTIDGEATLRLTPGSYRVLSIVPYVVADSAYSWDLPFAVSPSAAPVDVELTNLNAAALVAVADGVPGLRSVTQGFTVAMFGSADWLKSDLEGSQWDTGTGIGITLGWGFGRSWMIFLGGEAALADVPDDPGTYDYDLLISEFGVRYTHGGRERRWLWYGEGGLSTYQKSFSDSTVQIGFSDLQFHEGIGGFLGAGAQYYLTPAWALDFRVRWTTGQFDDFATGYEETRWSVAGEPYHMNGFRTAFGIAWYPMKRYRRAPVVAELRLP
jgi:hypothetical protein